MTARTKSFSYAVSVDGEGAATSEKGGSPIPAEDAWTPEHLLLTALARCTMTSLRYHAGREGVHAAGAVDADGEVSKRDTDERYAFVRIGVELDVTLDPAPASVRELIAKAERDCFVGASLTSTPDYRWTVNGEELA